jgi:hypothetical protein
MPRGVAIWQSPLPVSAALEGSAAANPWNYNSGRQPAKACGQTFAVSPVAVWPRTFNGSMARTFMLWCAPKAQGSL